MSTPVRPDAEHEQRRIDEELRVGGATKRQRVDTSDVLDSNDDVVAAMSTPVAADVREVHVEDLSFAVEDYAPVVVDATSPSVVNDDVTEEQPTFSDYIPVVEDYIPVVEDYTPVVEDYTPAAEDAVKDYVATPTSIITIEEITVGDEHHGTLQHSRANCCSPSPTDFIADDPPATSQLTIIECDNDGEVEPATANERSKLHLQHVVVSIDQGQIAADFRRYMRTRRRPGSASTGPAAPPCASAPINIAEETEANAVRTLQRRIQKSDFPRMRCLGQFNLGFILTRLDRVRDDGDDACDSNATAFDLFIVDQHASDEKFNFERLSRDAELKRQRLIA